MRALIEGEASSFKGLDGRRMDRWTEPPTEKIESSGYALINIACVAKAAWDRHHVITAIPDFSSPAESSTSLEVPHHHQISSIF